jgi:MFS family permease
MLPPATDSATGDKPPFRRRHRKSLHNFWNLVLYQTTLRTGWIFKTESIIIPAFMDVIGGSATLRGYLPMLNRFGQSIPPLLASPFVTRAKRKKFLLFGMTSLMAICFAVLAVGCATTARKQVWFPYFYLSVYTVFFAATGVMQLAFGTIQGKLVFVTRRGRLMLMSNLIGAITAITLAAICLRRWLEMGIAGFTWIFGCSATCFAIAAIVSLFLWEPRDQSRASDNKSKPKMFRGAVAILRTDRNFRRLAIVAALFGSSMMLFPHYQALAREQLHLDMKHLFYWVVIQNAGTAAFSFVVGPMADRTGNRRVIRLVLACLLGAPAVALILAKLPVWGPSLFPIVFLLVGLTPVGIRLLDNYTLEIASTAQQPQYLATLRLCLAAPIFCSPLMGWAIGAMGYTIPFLCISLLIAAAFAVSWSLEEPRTSHRNGIRR